MAIGAYRILLRAVRKHVSGDAGNPDFKAFIADEFRRNAGMQDSVLVRKKISLAKDYALLVTSVHAHKELLQSYNISIDREEEQSVRLQNTAKRVGLSMPKVFEEADGQK